MRMSCFYRLLLSVSFFAFTWLVLPTPVFAQGPYIGGTRGYDISYPQCGTSSFTQDASFGIVGVSGGRAFTYNPCLAQEFAWASGLTISASLYMNLDLPIDPTVMGMSGYNGTCQTSDKLCQAENYGYNAAQDAYAYAQQQGASATQWWLDIETDNRWSSSPTLNQGAINGAAQFFSRKAIPLGIYSIPGMWYTITSGYHNSLPVWLAVASPSPESYCSSTSSFTGGPVYLIQYSNPDASIDSDYAC